MKIYTKTGDKGTTALYGGLRLSKAELRIEAYGTVDELNSFLGLAATYLEEKEYSDLMQGIQSRLFDIGTHLAAEPGKKNLVLPEIPDTAITLLEQYIMWRERFADGLSDVWYACQKTIKLNRF